MATNIELPVRENFFFWFSAPEGDVTIDDLIDAVEATAGEDSILVLQHMGGAKFLVGTRNTSQATELMVAEGFKINNEKVAVEAVGPPVTFVNVYRYPAYLSDETLSNALAQYGKVKSITFATVASRHNKLNGVRVVKLEMTRPVSNFVTIAGHRVIASTRACAACARGAETPVTWPPPARQSIVSGAAPSATRQKAATPNARGAVGGTARDGTRLLGQRRARGDGRRESSVNAPPPPPTPIVAPSSAVDTSDTNTEGDQETGSGTGFSTTEASSDSRLETPLEGEEQQGPQNGEPLEEGEIASPLRDDANFPPLPCVSSAATNPDDMPIIASGRYQIPTDHGSCGVGVVFISGRFRQKSHCVFGANGRTLFLDVLLDGRRFRFVNVYAPATRSDTNHYFRELHDSLQEPVPYVLLGDFNCVVDSVRDVRGPGRGGSTYHARELVKLLRHLQLTDAWVHLHDDEFGPTRTSRTTATRLDRAYIPDLLLPAVVSCDILALPDALSRASDHAPFVTTVRGRPGTSSSDASWRLDPALLQDPESVSILQPLIENSLKATPCTSPEAWDNLKASWKLLLQQEGRHAKKTLHGPPKRSSSLGCAL
ncbi:hypothetical protein HPB52_023326 [Rhipicephalus sanguineus]|uniref:Endonuclease/exonuclease/phosphatase domain-containing protein n=1 Tax=Rhipicephalus sanguineus TaxID=34632 RepID=A0A9D4T513_RHISA|nr:hypothetical protein HPB52_023326 [Rhipicephalus sanguineus]